LKDAFASHRRKAKGLNFSIAYGKTPMGLSSDWGVNLAEAEATLELWYSDRPEVREWQQHTIDLAHYNGATRTLLGRYRQLPDIQSTTPGHRAHAERAAINTPIQGGAADIVIRAMVKLYLCDELKTLGWKQILQIHDEIILEGPEKTANEAFQLVKKIMRSPLDEPLLVDLEVDAKMAKTWYKAK
jgi:DNA polymerase-1